MTDFFEIFQPGLAHFKRWKDAEKVLFVDTKRAGSGRRPDDLDSGSLTVELPPEPGDPGEPLVGGKGRPDPAPAP